MHIGEVLKDWRFVEKMTLREAGTRLGISHPTLQRIEQGKMMDAETMVKLMRFLFEQ
jgi:transcriptional regulator with XRE-family HTH domain